MRRRFSLLVTLFAWLLATGGHWDLTQAVAWGRMFARYSQTMSLSSALQKTFSADGMCDICNLVAAAKQKESDAGSAPDSTGKSFGKLFIVFAPTVLKPAVLPITLWWSPGDQSIPSADRAAPPLRPPRRLA